MQESGHDLLRPWLRWTLAGRVLVFVPAAMSIWCLLAEMYGLCDMRTFALFILLPATLMLYGLAVLDRWRGDRRLWRAVIIGTLAGLVGAVAYDVFRLPFVFSRQWGLAAIIPPMPLFKVFPRFGAMLLGQPPEQPAYSLAAHLVGWAYHFSNGATFGVMFAAIALGAREAFAPRHFDWKLVGWATVMAVGIEVCLLVSPYSGFFGIHMTARFVVVTLAAHIIFGLALGLYFAWQAKRWSLTSQLRGIVTAQTANGSLPRSCKDPLLESQ